MKFDFKLFSAFAMRAYKSLGCPAYSFEDALAIFEYYFSKYEKALKRPHPNIRTEQIARIIDFMPYIENSSYSCHSADLDPENYEPLIDKHFKTKYRNCDYNINHFFSGDIRMMRFYEELY